MAVKTAIILGATGLTGGRLLELLLNDSRYSKIKLFSRSSVGVTDPKIEEYLGDMFNLEDYKDDFKGDEVFCCIGTTKSKTPNKDFYKKIDFGIPKSAALLAKSNAINTFIVISALGANANSSIFYNRIKGQMEEAVLEAHIPKTYILQPSLIGGKREERRLGEWVFKQLMKVANLVMAGPLKKYKTIHPETIAKAMVWLANNDFDGDRIPSDAIQEIAQRL
ncbi:NAD(P)H-binding protein [Maribacter polysiphoniae]|uniref:NAD(P)H-binding protein n=1 Tax=Maribacter polysiphoniae TaxID=429344 RepID=A0ABR7VYJ6_9FLAO|nr:NAD(P)H-binding protein [Maribacter polysiphoniae]MBD1260197.1 NAD(P)H-binding protein [Maribacter polysiphoniae]